MTLGGAELVPGLVLVGVIVLGALGFLLARLRQQEARLARAIALGGGAVLLIEDGLVIDATEEAAELFAAGAGSIVGRAPRDLLRSLFGHSAGTIVDAFDRLAESGEAFQTIAVGPAGERFAVHGAPRGGRLRLELRQVRPTGPAPERARDAAANQTGPGADGDARGVLASLVSEAPLLAWSRSADGTVAWAAGHIATPRRRVAAGEAAALATARRRSETGGPKAERFRLEVGAGEDDTIALDAIEVPAQQGGVHGIAVDAAGALEAERTLARFVRTMTETFAHLNVGLGIFDASQRLALFNPALVEMWQLDPAWLARRPSLREVLDRLRANRRIPEVADFHAWRTRLTGLFEDIEAADYEELWHLADGSDIRVLARPHPHGSLAFVFEDVTERLRLEQQYRHSIDLRRATLDRLEEGLAVFGPDGLLQFVNAAFHDIWGTDEETVHPLMHVRDLAPLIGGMTVETAVWARFTGFVTGAEARQPWGMRLTLATGRILGARVAGLPDGSTMAVFGDITDSERFAQALRERNESLEAAGELRTAVLDQISHRLRTPLHSIFGFGQLLADTRFGTLSEAQQGYAEQILDAARQLLGAVDDVTDLAALEIGSPREEGGEPTLGEALASTARLLEKRAIEEGVTLTVSTPEAALRPACEPGRLRQIVFGLATAAIGSCSKAGEVALSGRAGGETAELLVAVSAHDRAETGAPPPDCPTLPFIRRLVEQAGGEIEIASDAGSRRIQVRCALPTSTEQLVADHEPGADSG